MGRASFRVGQTVKSEHFCLSLENFSMLSMMLITMGAQLSPQLLTEKGSFQAEPKEKSESGKSPSKPKLCRYPSKNIAVESGPSKSAKTIPKLYLQAAMGHASFGISRNTPVCCACSKLQPSSRRSSILKNIKF